MLTVAVAGTLALTGCAQDASKVASLQQPGAAAATAAPDKADAISKLQQCFHDNGADLKVTAQGLQVADGVTQELFQQAYKACQELVAAATPRKTADDMPADLKAKLLQESKCIRAAGFPDWPDPDSTRPLESDPHTWPGFEEARAKCGKEAGLNRLGG